MVTRTIPVSSRAASGVRLTRARVSSSTCASAFGLVSGSRAASGSPSQTFSVRKVVAALGAAVCLGGCGHTIYAINVNSAAAKLEEAHELGAEIYAPYEYWFALEHLDKAQTEASEGDYGDAIELAGIGEEYADKAIQLARDAHRGAGR